MNGFSFYAPDDETFHHVLGYAITEWRYGFARLEMDVKPRHLAGGGYVHGGVLMGLIDVAALYAGNYVDGRRRPLVTINLATSFISSGRCARLVAEGRLQYAQDRMFFAEATVSDPDDGRVVAAGSGSFRFLAPPEEAREATRHPVA
ncbi:MAG: PaaI family thioesterase [Acetobacterales bacterium]